MKMLTRAALALLAAHSCAPAYAQDAQTLPKAFTYSLTGNEILAIGVPSAAGQGYSYQAVRASQIAALGGGSATPTTLNVSGIGRDGAGRVTSFTSSGTPYTVTYDAFGPATIAGGGKTTTVTRSAQGAVTGISTQ